MSKGHVTYRPEGRLGNALFQASAAMAYAADHRMPFHMPTESRDAKWCPTYLPHLASPDYNPALPVIMVEERGYPFQKLPWDERWRDSNVVLNGFFQSVRYWEHHREMILSAFEFPWTLRKGICAVHLRRGDYLIHTTKHPVVTPDWYLAQMSKIVQEANPEPMKFLFLSDDIEYCRKNFGYLGNAFFASKFEAPKWFSEINDSKPEVRDLIAGSQCEHVIGSASTFAVWMGLLGRNPGRRVIIPKEWIISGWQNTTAETWKDIVPEREGWERA